eukprot:gb/GEZN01004557.1/.p1 GENE.gb/GEZN01004557.1/~~gb/GEZN01004557.1/.p1  ORF type:complete len:602 (+),score=123.35 gb/GEZN01004557.1/:69-1874(+)
MEEAAKPRQKKQKLERKLSPISSYAPSFSSSYSSSSSSSSSSSAADAIGNGYKSPRESVRSLTQTGMPSTEKKTPKKNKTLVQRAKEDAKSFNLLRLSVVCFLASKQQSEKDDKDNGDVDVRYKVLLKLQKDHLEKLEEWLKECNEPPLDWFYADKTKFAKAGAKWAQRPFACRWLYVATALLNELMPSSSFDANRCPFLDNPDEGKIANSCTIHVTWLVALANAWNEKHNNEVEHKVHLRALASLDHTWLGLAIAGELVEFSVDQQSWKKDQESCEEEIFWVPNLLKIDDANDHRKLLQFWNTMLPSKTSWEDAEDLREESRPTFSGKAFAVYLIDNLCKVLRTQMLGGNETKPELSYVSSWVHVEGNLIQSLPASEMLHSYQERFGNLLQMKDEIERKVIEQAEDNLRFHWKKAIQKNRTKAMQQAEDKLIQSLDLIQSLPALKVLHSYQTLFGNICQMKEAIKVKTIRQKEGNLILQELLGTLHQMKEAMKTETNRKTIEAFEKVLKANPRYYQVLFSLPRLKLEELKRQMDKSVNKSQNIDSGWKKDDAPNFESIYEQVYTDVQMAARVLEQRHKRVRESTESRSTLLPSHFLSSPT